MRTLPLAVALATLILPLAMAAPFQAETHVDAKVGLPASAPPALPATAGPLPAIQAETPEAPDVPLAPEALEASALHGATSTAATGLAGSMSGAGFGARATTGDADEGAGESLTQGVVATVEESAPAAVATVGIVALLQAFGVWRFVGLGAVGLYSRLTKSSLLDNEHRDRVYKLIQESPGLGVSEIAERSGLGWGTTVYHLDRLERHGFVANERAGLHKCYYPVGTLAKEARKGIGALKADTTRSIAAFLVSKPGATQTELCDALGLSASAASKQVTKLEEAGLVRRHREWKTVYLFPAEPLHGLLATETPAVAPAPAPLAGLAA